jgi:hypothetical protein
VIAKIGQQYRVSIISEKWRCQKASKSGHGRAHLDSSRRKRPESVVRVYSRQSLWVHAFQLVVSLAYQPADCFRVHRPVVVPTRTFLSQLLHASSNENREKTSADGLWRSLSPAGTDNLFAPSRFLRTLVLTCAS